MSQPESQRVAVLTASIAATSRATAPTARGPDTPEGALMPSTGRGALPAFQLEVFVRCGERPAGDESQPRFRHPRALCVDEAELPDGRVHDLVGDERRDAVQARLAPLAVQLAGLPPEQSVDVGIAAVDVGTARRHEVLQADCRVPA